MFYHLPSVSPKELFALAHLGWIRELLVSFVSKANWSFSMMLCLLYTQLIPLGKSGGWFGELAKEPHTKNPVPKDFTRDKLRMQSNFLQQNWAEGRVRCSFSPTSLLWEEPPCVGALKSHNRHTAAAPPYYSPHLRWNVQLWKMNTIPLVDNYHWTGVTLCGEKYPKNAATYKKPGSQTFHKGQNEDAIKLPSTKLSWGAYEMHFCTHFSPLGGTYLCGCF